MGCLGRETAYFDYADIRCIGTYQRTLKKLQKQQNRALPICLRKDKRSKTNLLHIETGIPLLKDRRHIHFLNYMYKHKGKQDHQNSMSGHARLFDAVVFDNVTPHKTAVERSVYCKEAQAWNELPSGVRNIQTYDLFKTYQKHEALKMFMTKTLPVA